ncbi:UNVERIFIED_CONTAM: hypothetical protein HHA_297310 [Hammondia hammondi]|eukprot:XP_008886122.1 hypothetical protein HHA_297310 [Hammondia hammondi]
MHGAWWFRGPFVVPVIDTILTLLQEIYISIFWVKDIFNIKGVAKVPSSIPITWVAPGNALGSVWLPVVYISSFAILALHIWRMIVAAKHARNPFHPGVMHFVFGFSILATLGFAGVCGMLVSDSLGLVNKFTAQVQCAPLAGAVNQACVAARKFVADNRLQGQILLVLTAVVGLFAIFGEMIIIWACLEVCCFGPHIHCTVAGGACGGGCGHCGEAGPIAIACDPGGPAVVGCMSGGQCCPPVGIPIAPGCCPVDGGGCDRVGGSLRATSGPVGTGPISVGPVAGGSATSILPPTKTSTTTHTSHSNPCHASCPMDADTQQRTAVENPVANTCQISINTGLTQRLATNGIAAAVPRLLHTHPGAVALLVPRHIAGLHLDTRLLVTDLGTLPTLPLRLRSDLDTPLSLRLERDAPAVVALHTYETNAAELPQLKHHIGTRDGGRDRLTVARRRLLGDHRDIRTSIHFVATRNLSGSDGEAATLILDPCPHARADLPGAGDASLEAARCPPKPHTTPVRLCHITPQSTPQHLLSHLSPLEHFLAIEVTHSQCHRRSYSVPTSRCPTVL